MDIDKLIQKSEEEHHDNEKLFFAYIAYQLLDPGDTASEARKVFKTSEKFGEEIWVLS